MRGVGRHAVFVDANVLYSRTHRDWLALLYLESETFQVFWSEDVVTETIYHLRKDHPGWGGAQIAAVRQSICRTFEVGRVDDYVIDPSTTQRDVGDAHVHAAAVACDADILLTSNVADFAKDAPYEVMRPDAFFELVGASDPAAVRRVVRKQVDYWFRRRGSCDLPAMLVSAECPRFADQVVAHLQALARA